MVTHSSHGRFTSTAASLAFGCSPLFIQFAIYTGVGALPHPCLFAVFCGLPINRWCPGTLKIPGCWPLTLCLVLPPLLFAASGFLQFTYKLVVSRHPKNPGLFATYIVPGYTSTLFAACGFLQFTYKLVVSRHPKNPGWSLLFTQLTGAHCGWTTLTSSVIPSVISATGFSAVYL